ncbi:MAG: MBL fold metallo-hydrolase [Planctomycetota bacterium]
MTNRTRKRRGYRPPAAGEIARLTFHGAVGGVTGSCYLLETHGSRVLVDCGLFQGGRREEARNRRPFPVDPAGLDAVVLTHAHLDHSGLVPKLVADGYRGPVHATEPTADLVRIMWPDAGHIHEHDARRDARRALRRGAMALPPLYDVEDAQRALDHVVGHPFREEVAVAADVAVRFRRAGHILGSASVEALVRHDGVERRIVVSGDLGRATEPILLDPDPPAEADLLLLESTYGARDHRGLEGSLDELRRVLVAAREARENVIVPVFAVGRAQEILFYLSRFEREEGLELAPVFLDSPMAIHVSELYRRHTDCFEEPVRGILARGEDPLEPRKLAFCRTPEESKALNDERGIVVLAASGMCTAGRVVHHLKHGLWREGTHVVIVGFQALGTTGRALVDGARRVSLLGETVAVRAQVHTIGGFSAHAGQSQLVDWSARLRTAGARLALVHGETNERTALAARLAAHTRGPILLPLPGDAAGLRRDGEPVAWQPLPRTTARTH